MAPKRAIASPPNPPPTCDPAARAGAISYPSPDEVLRGDPAPASKAMRIVEDCGGHRKSEVLRRYFPTGCGATLKLPAARALPIAEGLHEAMDDETSTDITSRREPLTAARDLVGGAQHSAPSGSPASVPAPTIALVPPQATAPDGDPQVADGAASDVAA